MFELKLENSNGDIINIDDGVRYIITDITGLNPPSASLFTSKSPNRKGVKYNGSTLDERTIIISIKLLGDIEFSRNHLYEWIETENYVKIYYRNGIKNVYCEGHIYECEFNIFTDNEIIDLAITCEDPYWKDLNEIVTEISNIINQFTLPFNITNPVPFATFREDTNINIYNSGTETGLKITIKCLGEVTNLTIYNPNDMTKQFKLNTTLLEDWVVEINSESSPKTVKAYKPDGTVENLLKYTGGNITWFTLKRGINYFGYSADSGQSNAEVSFAFTNKYIGV